MASQQAYEARRTRVGDVLKAVESEMFAHGYHLETRTVTVSSLTAMDVGAVLEETSVSGKATWVTASTVANASCILLDEGVYDLTATGDATLYCLVRGPAIVGTSNLSFSGTVSSANITTAIAALKAQNVLSGDQV